MKLYGLTFTKDTIGDIQRIVDANSAISRRSLSRQLCELFDWHSVTGRFKEVVCRKALVMLRNLGLVQLPDIVSVPGFKTPGTPRAPYQRPAVACSLQELGCVELIPQTCGSRAKTKAAYRFFDHKKATLQNIL